MPVEFVEQHVQRGTGDAVSVALTAFPTTTSTTTTTSSCCPATRRCCAPTTIAAPGRRAPRRRRRVHAAHRRASPTRPATAASCAARTAASPRIVEQADATDEEREIDEINTSIYCFRRSLLAPALRRLSPENAQGEYYLTDVVAVLRRRRPPGASRSRPTTPTETPGRQRPGPAGRGRGRAAAPHQRRAGCAPASRWSTPSAPTSTPRSSSRPTSRCSRARSCRAAPSIGAGAEIGPDTRLVDCVVGAGRRRRADRRPRRRDRRRRRVGPFAVLEPGSAVPSGAVHRAVLHCDRDGRRGSTTGSRGRSTGMELVTKKRLHALLPGRANPPLAEEIAEHLDVAARRAEPGRVRQRRDPLPLRRDHPRRRRVHHPDATAADASVNDAIMEQLIMIDAAKRASAKRITAVCPFYGYARQDRKAEGREPITAKLVADMFTAAGADRAGVSVDLHSGQIQGFFDGPVDHLTAMPVLVDYLGTSAGRRPRGRVARRRSGEGGRALRQHSSTPTSRSSTSAGRRARRTRSRRARSSATSTAARACSSTT